MTRIANFWPARLATLLLLLAAACSSSPAVPADHGLGGAGGGGSSGADPTAGSAGTIARAANCPDSSGPVDPTALIDDMESGGAALPMEGRRNGSWWAGGDMVSPNATIDPNGDAPSELIPNGGRCGSLHAKHVTGQGFTSWAVLTATLSNGLVDGGVYAALPYDAHIRTGVTFWARIGDTSANQVRFAVSDKYTRPEGGILRSKRHDRKHRLLRHGRPRSDATGDHLDPIPHSVRGARPTQLRARGAADRT